MHTTDYEDDLMVIKGIGPSRQRWLRESLGVRTFQDLASLSVDKVVSQLRAEGRTASSSEVEAWIEQARQLSASVEQPVNMEATKEQTNSPNDVGDWKPFASFVVEFQARTLEGKGQERRTTAHYMEADIDARWPGIENLQLCRWMLEQIGDEPWPELQQQLEDERTQALGELEEKRRQAEEELEQELKQERSQARQELEQDLEEMRTQARQRLEQQLEDERTQALEELEEKRRRAEEELEQELERERTQARQELQEEQTETREALAQAQQELQQKLEEERAKALEELEQELKQERSQARQELQQELEEIRAQVQRELELPLEESTGEQQPAPKAEEPDEKRRVQPRREPEEAPAIEAPPAETSSVGEMPISITITQVRAVQPPDAERPTVVGERGQQLYGFLRGDTPCVFEAQFEIAESAVGEVVREGITYSAQFYVRDMSTGTKLHLGNTQPEAFIEGESFYTATLSDITLPPGVYRLSILVTLQNRHPSADYYVMPVLQVA